MVIGEADRGRSLKIEQNERYDFHKFFNVPGA